MSILKVGVIGCGFMGKTHVENLRRLGFVEVAAVAGVSPEEAQRFANSNYIPKAAASYQEILADPEIGVGRAARRDRNAIAAGAQGHSGAGGPTYPCRPPRRLCPGDDGPRRDDLHSAWTSLPAVPACSAMPGPPSCRRSASATGP